MATYSQVPTIVTGDLATASWGNTYVRDNFSWFAQDHDHSGDPGDGGEVPGIEGVDLGAETTVAIVSGSASITDAPTKITSESGTYDVLAELTGLNQGQVAVLRADSGDIILVEHGTNNIQCPKGQNIVLTEDQYTLFYYDGSNFRVIGREISAYEATTRTINFDNSMTAADINNIIQAVDHFIPPGQELIFQFADGTYTFGDSLEWNGFYGGGELNVFGNTGESGLHTNQAVVLDFDGQQCDGIRFVKNNLKILVDNLRIDVDPSGDHKGIYAESCKYIKPEGCYVNASSTSAGDCIYMHDGTISGVVKCYVSGAESGITSSLGSTIVSNDNDDTGTQPVYGLDAVGALIYTVNTQPTGSTSNQRTASGGEIR